MQSAAIRSATILSLTVFQVGIIDRTAARAGVEQMPAMSASSDATATPVNRAGGPTLIEPPRTVSIFFPL